MRLIDAENLLKQYEQIDWYCVSKEGQFMRGATTEDNPFIHYYDGEEIIKNAPTIETDPVRHGEWEIVVGSNEKEYMVCTCCRVSQDLTGVFTYCPNCGAKMDGGDGNSDIV